MGKRSLLGLTVWLLLGGLLSGGALGVSAGSAQARTSCSADIVNLRGPWGQAEFAVSVVDTPETRARGLMFVESMPRFSGMLFVYETPRSVSFWMRNTLIPLDMIFADSSGTVRKVHVNAIPGDLTSIPGGSDIQYVLEINGGLSKTLGISPGSELRHPAIDAAQAAWPCD